MLISAFGEQFQACKAKRQKKKQTNEKNTKNYSKLDRSGQKNIDVTIQTNIPLKEPQSDEKESNVMRLESIEE